MGRKARRSWLGGHRWRYALMLLKRSCVLLDHDVGGPNNTRPFLQLGHGVARKCFRTARDRLYRIDRETLLDLQRREGFHHFGVKTIGYGLGRIPWGQETE